jgi:hypothetical protein
VSGGVGAPLTSGTSGACEHHHQRHQHWAWVGFGGACDGRSEHRSMSARDGREQEMRATGREKEAANGVRVCVQDRAAAKALR